MELTKINVPGVHFPGSGYIQLELISVDLLMC